MGAILLAMLKHLTFEDCIETCTHCKGEGKVPRHAPFRFRVCDFCNGRRWRFKKGTPERIIKRFQQRR